MNSIRHKSMLFIPNVCLSRKQFVILQCHNIKQKEYLGEETVIIHKDEALLVEGRIPHSCWNNTDGVTKMIGITVQ